MKLQLSLMKLPMAQISLLGNKKLLLAKSQQILIQSKKWMIKLTRVI